MDPPELSDPGPTPSRRGPGGRAALMIALICRAVAAGSLWNAGAEADRALTSVVGGSPAAAAAGAIGAGALVLVRRTTEARRLAGWEREGEQVEPEWSGRLRRRGSAPEVDDD